MPLIPPGHGQTVNDLDTTAWLSLINQNEADIAALRANPAWTDITLPAGWTAFGAPYPTLGWTVSGTPARGDQVLYLRGAIRSPATSPVNTVLGTLPVGARPLAQAGLYVAAGTSLLRVDVRTDGAIVVTAALASTTTIVISESVPLW